MTPVDSIQYTVDSVQCTVDSYGAAYAAIIKIVSKSKRERSDKGII